MTEQDVLNLIERDRWMMGVLRVAESLNLPDWMIGAGFVRNKVWDHLHGFKNEVVPTADIDLAYFDLTNLDEEQEKQYDRKLQGIMDIEWSCKNQARMHQIHGGEPYISSEDAISAWPETCTCVAVKFEDGKLKLIAPHGISDLVNLIVRRSPNYRGSLESWHARIAKKGWQNKWPKLKFVKEMRG